MQTIKTMEFFGIIPRDYQHIPEDVLELSMIIESMIETFQVTPQPDPATNNRLMLLTDKFVQILAQSLEAIPRFATRIKMTKDSALKRFDRTN